MKNPDFKLHTPSLVLSLMLTATASSAGVINGENLFFIKRSKNANEVHYDARVENCLWSKTEVDYYWRDLEQGINVTSEIMPWEPPAYGFKVNRSSDSEITIILNALPDKKITARLSKTEDRGCSVSKTIEISGKPAELRSVYVDAREKKFLGIPYGATVHYIDILGISKDGEFVFERIIRTEEGKERGTSRPDVSHWSSGAPSMGRPQ